jgi:hypothetical protein
MTIGGTSSLLPLLLLSLLSEFCALLELELPLLLPELPLSLLWLLLLLSWLLLLHLLTLVFDAAGSPPTNLGLLPRLLHYCALRSGIF